MLEIIFPGQTTRFQPSYSTMGSNLRVRWKRFEAFEMEFHHEP
jgi:hypothetical protein